MPAKSVDFRQDFLLEFTKEILKNTHFYIKIKVKRDENRIQREEIETGKTTEQKKEIKDIVIERIKQQQERISSLKKDGEIFKPFMERPQKKLSNVFQKTGPLKSQRNLEKISIKKPLIRSIEEPPLPSTVRDIRPTISGQINLGKLTPLARDPLVKTIESKGAGQPIIVTGLMGVKKTRFVLNQNEINGLIERFAQSSKIPFEEGFFKASYGGYIISAIVSMDTGSRFLISKMG